MALNDEEIAACFRALWLVVQGCAERQKRPVLIRALALAGLSWQELASQVDLEVTSA